ncbi:MAG: hypothetical protein LBM94_02490 [Propionibacteriaceae bacterium]|jgi:hypothetical protein|nr:hypothetical protein [Propionibacteriaceae bacterium]
MSEPIRDGRRLDVGAILSGIFGGAALGALFSGLIAFAMLLAFSQFVMSDSENSMVVMDWWVRWLTHVDWLPNINSLADSDAIAMILVFMWIKAGLPFLVIAKPVSMLVHAKYALPSGTDSYVGRLSAWGLVLLIFLNPPNWTLGVGLPYVFNLDAISYAAALHILGGAYDVMATFKRSPWAQNVPGPGGPSWPGDLGGPSGPSVPGYWPQDPNVNPSQTRR